MRLPRLTRPARPKLTWPGAIALLALVVATSGTAVAATGQIVNIADGTNAGQVAHVDGSGRLFVSPYGLTKDNALLTEPGGAAQPLNLTTTSNNAFGCCGTAGELIAPTQAKINLSALTVALAGTNTDPWRADLEITTVPNGTAAGSCSSAATASTLVMALDVSPGQTVTWSSPAPLVFAPPAGQTRCLIVYAYNDAGTEANNTSQLFASGTGYVMSGTYTAPHGTSAPIRPSLRKPAGKP